MRLRYRPVQAVVIALLAALITACAGFAPLYDRAMRQALTDIAIEHTSPAETGLQLLAIRTGTAYFGGHEQVPPPSPEGVAAQVPRDMRDFYLPPILSYAATALVSPGDVTDPGGALVWRDGACDHLAFVDGGCPARPGDIAVSEKDVELFGLDVGTTLRVGGVPGNGPKARVPQARMTVTGVYRQTRDDYWFGLDLTGRSGIVDAPPSGHIQHDVWITDRSTFDSGDLPPFNQQTTSVDLPLDRAHVGVDDLLALSAAIADFADDARAGADGTSVDVHSGLSDIAKDVRSQIKQSRVTVPLLMAQLGLLAVVVLWLVLLAVTEQRRPEVALARLRGRGRRGARGLLLGELLPVALAGVVPGAVLAVLAVWVARTAVLPGNAPFELGLRFVAALAIAVAVLALITGVAVARVAREPVETLLRRVPTRRTRWGLGVADAFVVAGAGGVVVVFATGGLDGPVALAAPGLLAGVVGLLLAHLTSPTAAVLGRRLLRRGRVRAGVSVLDAARSPATRRVVAIVTLAAALAVFSADALLVGERNRASAADQQAGAPMVADVVGTDLAGVRAALAEVDPVGREVTPVAKVLPPGSDTGGTLAVVPDSFRRIALFAGGASPASVWAGLRAPDTEPIQVTGSHVEVDVDDSTLHSVRADRVANPVNLGIDLVTPAGETLHTLLGRLDGRTDHARLGTDVSCRDGCYVTAVWLGTLPGASIDGRATLRNLVGQPGDDLVAIGPQDQWTAYDDPDGNTVTPTSTDDHELTVAVHSKGPTLISMSQNWIASQVPVLVSEPLPTDLLGDRLTILGLDGTDRLAERVGELPRVPGSRPGTTVVNLDVVGRGVAIGPNTDVTLWFADDDPAVLADVTEALADHGISLSGHTTLADVRRSYDDSAAAWSLQLAALVGGASILIALLVLLVSAVSSWRFRARDLAALRMSGIPGRSIRSMAVAAQLPAVVIGVVAGTVSGLAGAQLALPIVPLFATAPEVSTLDLDTAWGGVVAAGLAALVVLALGSILIGRALARRSDVRRLRETL